MSLVGRVCLLVLLAAAPAFGLQLYKDLEQRREGEAQIHEEALRLTRFAAGELDKILEGARVFLLAVAAHPAVQSGDAAGCREYLANMAQPPAPFLGAAVIDLRGEIICSTRPVGSASFAGDQDYFRDTVTSRHFTVGQLVNSRIDPRQRILPIAAPILSSQGELHGVVVTGLSATALQGSFENKAWPPGGSISLVDKTGAVIVRSPNPELVGSQIPSGSRWMLKAPAEGTAAETGPDGVERIAAFEAPAANHGVLLSVALTKQSAVAKLDMALYRDLALLAATAALAFAAAVLGGGRFLKRPIDRLAGVADRLAHGDLSARAALLDQRSELGRLGGAIDEMASAFEQRTLALRHSEELFREFAENLPEIVWVEDAATRHIEYVSPTYEKVWQRPLAEVGKEGTGWLDAVLPEDRARLLAALRRAHSGEPVSAEYRIHRPDGEERWLHSTAFPLWGQDGNVVRVARITRDITEQRRLELEREQALEQRDLVFRELNHRIRNNLQIVGALLRLQSGRMSDPEAKDALDAAGQRITAVGELHAMLDTGRTVGRLDFGDYLQRLCASLAAALSEDRERVRIVCRTVPLSLDMDRAVPLALIASELITNSLKYAYPPPATGEVTVELARGHGDQVSMTVRDRGRGFEGEPVAGFGLGIIRLFTSQLNAHFELTGTDGATAKLEFTAPAEVERAAA
ncbi:MAG: histidine kinase dimerization/phosphoacceptor domain -containing protein [Geminicoccaceae bacterium]